MVPLDTYQDCSSAENLQNSQGKFSAQRASRAKLCMRIGTWNVQSMVDTEGPIEVASQRADGQRGEDRKADQIVCELARYDVGWSMHCRRLSGLGVICIRSIGVYM